MDALSRYFDSLEALNEYIDAVGPGYSDQDVERDLPAFYAEQEEACAEATWGMDDGQSWNYGRALSGWRDLMLVLDHDPDLAIVPCIGVEPVQEDADLWPEDGSERAHWERKAEEWAALDARPF